MQPQQQIPQSPQTPQTPMTVPTQVSGGSGKNHKGIVIGLGVLSFILLIFSIWAFMGYLSASSDQQAAIDAAVEAARADQKIIDEKAAEEAAKLPYLVYSSPDVVAGVKISYPRSWSVYVEEDESDKTQVDLYAHPKFVFGDSDAVYALRATITKELYTKGVDSLNSQVKSGKLKAKAVKISGITGTRYDGEIKNGLSGAMVLLPIRDKTLTIWTETNNYLQDFTKILEELDVTT